MAAGASAVPRVLYASGAPLPGAPTGTSETYAADLQAGTDPVRARRRLLDVQSAIVAEQNQRRSHSRHWRIFEAAELVLGDVKISARPSA